MIRDRGTAAVETLRTFVIENFVIWRRFGRVLVCREVHSVVSRDTSSTICEYDLLYYNDKHGQGREFDTRCE